MDKFPLLGLLQFKLDTKANILPVIVDLFQEKTKFGIHRTNNYEYNVSALVATKKRTCLINLSTYTLESFFHVLKPLSNRKKLPTLPNNDLKFETLGNKDI